MKKIYISLLVIVISIIKTNAQDLFGYSNLNASASATANPANIVGSRFKWNMNLISTNVYMSNNMYEMDSKKLFSFNLNGIKEGTDYFKVDDNSVAKKFAANIDFIGPSAMLNLGKRTAIGFTTRVRTMLSFDNLSNGTFQLFTSDSNKYYNQSFSESNVRLSVHSFYDVGVNFARTIWKDDKHSFKVGATLKYVKGIGAGYIHVDDIKTLKVSNKNYIDTMAAHFDVAYSANSKALLDGNVGAAFSEFGNASGDATFATDLGVVYQYQTNKKFPYKIRIGASITDIAFKNFTYENGSSGGNYKIEKGYIYSDNIDIKNMDYNDYFKKLNDSNIIVHDTGSLKTFTVALPTAFHLNIDYHIYNKFYANFYGLFNMASTSTNASTSYLSTYIATIRYERKWFSAAMPISTNSNNEFNVGAGLQVGPLFIGSGSVLSNLTKNRIRNTDFKLALSYSLFRKYKDFTH